MSTSRNGWQAESHVQDLLNEQFGESMVLPLAPSYSADFYVIGYGFVEVKGGRTKGTARRKLTPGELQLQAFCQAVGWRYEVIRVLTFPDGHCEVIGRGA